MLSKSFAKKVQKFSFKSILNNNINISYLQKLNNSNDSFWSKIELGPKDPILGIQENFIADPNPNKVNLGVGAYRDDSGKPWILPSVKKAESILFNSSDYNHEYYPIIGSKKLCVEAKKLMYGEKDDSLENMASMQALSGTGSLRVIFGFIKEHWLKKFSNLPIIHLPNETWGNHRTIIKHSGLEYIDYPYYNKSTNALDFENMINYFNSNKISSESIVLFHAIAHNPTGIDPTQEQWKEIGNVIKKKKCLVLFDSAYQGFASGDCIKDAFAPRYFRNELKIKNIMLAQSFAKNMGLYGQRVGCVSIDCIDKEEHDRVLSQIKMIARAMYSNPPIHGGKIAEILLSNNEIKQQWLNDDIKVMSNRIIKMREMLRDELENKLKSNLDWKHITDQIGMFCFTGLKPEMCDKLMEKYSIYLTRNGRISIAGLNTKNYKQVAQAFHEVTK